MKVNRLSRMVFIEQACELLNQRGRTEFALSDVLATCGAQKGSLYHFFPRGKGELVVAAVNHMSDCAYAHVQKSLEAEESVADAVYRHVTDLAKWVETPDRPIAMPFTAIAAITGDDDEEVRMACLEALKRLEGAFCEGLRADGLKKQEASSLAIFIITAIEGAFLLARTSGTSKPLRNAAKQLRYVILSYSTA